MLASISTSVEMERAMGIEPTLSAWEAEVLPLNYARPVPKGWTTPEGVCPFGSVGADLSRDRPPRGSQRSFEPGRSLHPLSRPLQPGIRFLRDPLPATDRSDFTTRLVVPRGTTLLRFYPVPCIEHDQEDSTFLPVIVLSACPHQAWRHPITYRFGQSLSVDLAHSSLTAFTSGSLMLVL